MQETRTKWSAFPISIFRNCVQSLCLGIVFLGARMQTRRSTPRISQEPRRPLRTRHPVRAQRPSLLTRWRKL